MRKIQMKDSPNRLHFAFTSVISAYQEAAEASGHIRAIDYTQPQGGDNSFKSCVVRPSTSDFICDCEIAARRCLTSGELAYFLWYYKPPRPMVIVSVLPNGNADEPLGQHIQTFAEKQWSAVWSLDNRMREKLGRRFIESKIFPSQAYFESEDVRGLKLKTTPRDNVINIRACADDTFEPLLGVPEAAELLGLHPKTVQALARAGDVPCFRLGKYWRFRASVLNEWVESRLICDHQSRRAS
jgi:excisionase family DNA binding protein